MALSSDDKKWVKNNFASNKALDEVKKEMRAMGFRLGLEFDEKMDRLEEKMDGRFDVVMTTLDEMMKELKAGREHDLVVAHQQGIQDNRLDVLESAVGV